MVCVPLQLSWGCASPLQTTLIPHFTSSKPIFAVVVVVVIVGLIVGGRLVVGLVVVRLVGRLVVSLAVHTVRALVFGLLTIVGGIAVFRRGYDNGPVDKLFDRQHGADGVELVMAVRVGWVGLLQRDSFLSTRAFGFGRASIVLFDGASCTMFFGIARETLSRCVGCSWVGLAEVFGDLSDR